MKNPRGSNQFKTKGINRKTKFIAMLIVSIIAISFGVYAFKAINSWFNTNYFVFTAPVEVKLNQPISVKERKPIEKKIVLDYPDEIDTPIEKYICEKFGVYDCKVALAIASAESGLREQALNINTNSTIDVGIFQVNSVHVRRAGCSLKELVDQYKNVDCAYTIFKEQGWNPWVVYKNGSYLVKL
jgi:hypothetical protein